MKSIEHLIAKDSELFLYDVVWHTLEEMENLDPTYVDSFYTMIRADVDILYTHVFPRICLVCDKSLGGFELHHAIVSRQDVRGWRHKTEWHDAKTVRLILITNVLNCIPLHPWCNQNNAPTREQAWEALTKLWGESLVRRWYEGLPWKDGVPRLFWEE